MGRGGHLHPSHWAPPRGTTTALVSVLVNMYMQNANAVWNFVAFAHLRYLRVVLRFCVEGQAWVRVGVPRVVKASLRLYT